MIDLREEAAKRRERGQALTGDTRHFSKDCHLVGIYGEKAFADLLDIEYEPAQQGDGGVDFEIKSMKIDVKTTQHVMCLLERENKRHSELRADIYVLAHLLQGQALMVSMNERDFALLKPHVYVEFLGWEWGHILKKQPVRSFGHAALSHYVPAAKLKPMARLLTMLKGE